MTNFTKKIAATIYKHGMAAPGDRLLLAVSGGPDSMAMLHALYALSEELDVSLAVAHMDHGLRPESGDEARFVCDAAAELGLECVIERAELSLEKGPGVNMQELARRRRYAFLEKTASELGAIRVALGHTRDDQAETFLMRLLRGSGTKGLSGIPPVREMFIRPLIDVTRKKIEAYLEEYGVKYVVDPSNLKTAYLRNRIRLELMPVIADINPSAPSAFARDAELLRMDEEYLERAAADALDNVTVQSGPGSLAVELSALAALHPAVATRLVRAAYSSVKGNTLGLGLEHVDAVLKMAAEGHTSTRAELPGGVLFRIEYGEGVFTGPGGHEDGTVAPYSYPLVIGGLTEVPEAGIIIRADLVAPSVDTTGGVTFDMSLLTGPLAIRNRRPGDRFNPAGMSGTKKLKDYFIDARVPQAERYRVPILVTGEDIVWVLGYRADGRFVADPGREGGELLRVAYETI